MQIVSARMCKHFFGRVKSIFPILLGLLLVFSVPGWSRPYGNSNDQKSVRERTPSYERQRPARKDRPQQTTARNRSSYGNNQRLRNKAQQWDKLPPQKQDELRHRMDRFKSMPPEERNLYKKRFDQMQQLPPDQQKEIRNKLRRMDRLSPAEKEEIRRKFE